MKSKNKFRFKTRERAYLALCRSFREEFDWIYEELDYWLPEFLRDSPDDYQWMNNVINLIGFDWPEIKYWFYTQLELPHLWSKTDFKTITKFAAGFKSMEF